MLAQQNILFLLLHNVSIDKRAVTTSIKRTPTQSNYLSSPAVLLEYNQVEHNLCTVYEPHIHNLMQGNHGDY